MTFPWTLERYIFREMGKTFLLTVVALTAVLGLGGGVLNMIKLGEATPGQLLRLMGLVVPIAVALTLPIAALFSAAATYGRLSADNEFVACRSSGINMHALFLPTVVLSVVSAAVTFVLINFVIPGMVRNLNEFIGADIGTMIERRLSRPRGITLGGRFRIYADETLIDAADPNRITLHHVAFVEVQDEAWVRFGTAQTVHLDFDRRETGVRVSGALTGLSYYDRKLGQFVELAEEVIPPNELPTLVPQKIKFLNLGELLYHWSAPSTWREVRQELNRLRMSVGRRVVYDALWEDWLDGRELAVTDKMIRYRIRSRLGARIPRDGGIELTNVSIEEDRRGQQRSYTAERANLEIARGNALAECQLAIDLYDVRVTDGDRVFSRTKDKLTPVAIPVELAEQVAGLTPDELMHPGAGEAADDPLAAKRAQVQAVMAGTVREIAATVSERFAFSISVFVLVILGAVLGIVFRGAHVLTAFGVSFVPSLLIIITIVMGKQMSQNATTHAFGLLVMWSGIVIVAGLDLWTLTRVLRR